MAFVQGTAWALSVTPQPRGKLWGLALSSVRWCLCVQTPAFIPDSSNCEPLSQPGFYTVEEWALSRDILGLFWPVRLNAEAVEGFAQCDVKNVGRAPTARTLGTCVRVHVVCGWSMCICVKGKVVKCVGMAVAGATELQWKCALADRWISLIRNP